MCVPVVATRRRWQRRTPNWHAQATTSALCLPPEPVVVIIVMNHQKKKKHRHRVCWTYRRRESNVKQQWQTGRQHTLSARPIKQRTTNNVKPAKNRKHEIRKSVERVVSSTFVTRWRRRPNVWKWNTIARVHRARCRPHDLSPRQANGGDNGGNDSRTRTPHVTRAITFYTKNRPIIYYKCQVQDYSTRQRRPWTRPVRATNICVCWDQSVMMGAFRAARPATEYWSVFSLNFRAVFEKIPK